MVGLRAGVDGSGSATKSGGGSGVRRCQVAGLTRRRVRPQVRERWIRTLKDQCLWAQLHDTVDELRQAVAGFIDRYNSSWPIQRHGHRTPREAYQAARSARAA